MGKELLLSCRDTFRVIRFPSGKSLSRFSVNFSLPSSTIRVSCSALSQTVLRTNSLETTFLIILRTLLTVRWFRAAFASIEVLILSSSSELLLMWLKWMDNGKFSSQDLFRIALPVPFNSLSLPKRHSSGISQPEISPHFTECITVFDTYLYYNDAQYIKQPFSNANNSIFRVLNPKMQLNLFLQTWSPFCLQIFPPYKSAL